MVVLVRCLWWALSLGLVLFGCEAGESSIEPASRASDGASGQTSVQGCAVGAPCSCDNGHNGYFTECWPKKSCSCESCPEFRPNPVPDFQACSGDVVGDWSLESLKIDPEPLSFPLEFGRMVWCSTQAASARFRLKLSILSDNRAALDMSDLPYLLRFSTSCSTPDGSCSDYFREYGDGHCKDLGCGVCECERSAFDAQYSDSLRVQVREQTLTFVTNTSAVAEFKYCVDGERLILNTNIMTATLRKSAFGGIPSSCESRDESTCETGAFCRWGSDGCVGSAPTRCLFADFGVVPGCEVYEPDAACSMIEAPKSCAEPERMDCNDMPGCEWQTGCKGPAIDCNELWLRSGICDVDGGCQKVSAEECTGTAECPKHTSQMRCQELNQCTWIDQCLVAEEVPCEEYTVSECKQYKRCEIVGDRVK